MYDHLRRSTVFLFSIVLAFDLCLGIVGFFLGRRSVVLAPPPAIAVEAAPPVVESREPVRQPELPAAPLSRRRSAPSFEAPVSPGRRLAFTDIEDACGDLMEKHSNFLCLLNRGSEVAAGGARLVLTEDLASFSIRMMESSSVSIEVEGRSQYHLDFGPRKGERLVRGFYSRAERWPFNKGPYAGIDFSVETGGCNEEEGQFHVLEYGVEADRKVLRLVTDFETTCNDAIGRISIVAGVKLPPERPEPKIEIRRHEPGF